MSEINWPQVPPEVRKRLFNLYNGHRNAMRFGIAFGVGEEPDYSTIDYYNHVDPYDRQVLEQAFWDTQSTDAAKKAAALGALQSALGTNADYTQELSAAAAQAIINGDADFDMILNIAGQNFRTTYAVAGESPGSCGGSAHPGTITGYDWSFNIGTSQYSYDIQPTYTHTGSYYDREDGVRTGYWTNNADGEPGEGMSFQFSLEYCSPVVCKNGTVIAGGSQGTSGIGSRTIGEQYTWDDGGTYYPEDISSYEFWTRMAPSFGLSHMGEAVEDSIRASLQGVTNHTAGDEYSIGFDEGGAAEPTCGAEPLPGDGSSASYSTDPVLTGGEMEGGGEGGGGLSDFQEYLCEQWGVPGFEHAFMHDGGGNEPGAGYGIDVLAPAGTPVFALAEGAITSVDISTIEDHTALGGIIRGYFYNLDGGKVYFVAAHFDDTNGYDSFRGVGPFGAGDELGTLRAQSGDVTASHWGALEAEGMKPHVHWGFFSDSAQQNHTLVDTAMTAICGDHAPDDTGPGDGGGTGGGGDGTGADVDIPYEDVPDLSNHICTDAGYSVYCPDDCDPPGGGYNPYDPDPYDPYDPDFPGGPGDYEPPDYPEYPPYDDGDIDPYDPPDFPDYEPPGDGNWDPDGITCITFNKPPPGFIDPTQPGGIGKKYQPGETICLRDEIGIRRCGKITRSKLLDSGKARICIDSAIPDNPAIPQKRCFRGNVQDIIGQLLAEMGVTGSIIFDSVCTKTIDRICFPPGTRLRTILNYMLDLCDFCVFPQFDGNVIVGFCTPLDVHWYYHEDVNLIDFQLDYDNLEAFSDVMVVRPDRYNRAGTAILERGYEVGPYHVNTPFNVPENILVKYVPFGFPMAEALELCVSLARKHAFRAGPIITFRVPLELASNMKQRHQVHIARPSVSFAQRYMVTKLQRVFEPAPGGWWMEGLARYLGVD